MTMETVNNLLEAACRGTLLGICISFWILGLASIWKWFLGTAKKILHWLFPKCRWFQSDKDAE